MEEIGLFPLGIVLVPTERVPLHIFEPRYRELIGECLELEREFGLVLEDDEGLRAVGTRTRVAEVIERLPDGRLNIVVEGGERFRLVEESEGRSFRTGRVEPFADEVAPATADEVEGVLAAFRRLAEAAGAEADVPEPSDSPLSFALAARIELPAGRKQALLELRSEQARVRMLSELLERLSESLAAAQELAERARRNGSR
ncbi:MAG TPA: LON peptidase substrate-binding domain-containing protein [Gaiellaceae bacterium]